MPKTTLTFAALIWASMAFGQLKITTTQFKGETYKVYPVRLPIESESEFYVYRGRDTEKKGLWKAYDSELSLPFNPFKLEDGKYLVYFEKRKRKFDKNERVWIYSHEDTTLVAATFSLKNNKKTGLVTWYDHVKPFKQVQTGNYTDGVKNGEWRSYRKNELRNYHYANGVLHGKYISTYKSKLYRDYNYLFGKQDGMNISYHKKSSVAHIKTTYNNGAFLEQKKYDKKNRLTYWYTSEAVDGINSRNYDKGILTKTTSEPDSFSCYTYRSWYKDGTLKYVSYMYEHPYHRSKNIIHTQPWFSKKNRGMLDELGLNKRIAYESYHKNGQLRVKYDARTTDFQQPVKWFNKKGRLYKTYQMDANDSSLINILSYNKKNFQYYKRVSYMGKENVLRLRTTETGDTSYYTATPYYLSIHNPDKVGFVKSYYSSGKKYSDTEYNLLHSTVAIPIGTFKNSPTLSFDHKTLNDTMIEVNLHEHDIKNEFKVSHTYKLRLPKRSDVADLVYFYDSETDTKSISNIASLRDTLDYKVSLFGQPFSGNIQIKEKFTYKDKRYKLKLKIRKIRYGKTVYFDTTIKLTTYVGLPYSYWYTNNVHLNVYGGEVTRIRLGDDDANYTNSTKTGEGQDHNGFTGHYLDGMRHGLYQDGTNYAEYYKGMKHGLDMKLGYYGSEGRYDNQLKYKANFDMDTLHGLFVSFAKPEVVQQSLVFNKGLPNGQYFRGNVTSPVTVTVDLQDGYLVDTGYYYFKEGILKAKVHYQLKDSVFYLNGVHHPYYVTGAEESDQEINLLYLYDHTYNESTILNRDKIIDFESHRTGDYQYFYKNGVMASMGRIERSQKIGTWQYWDLNGQLYKEITYDTGWHVSANNDSIKYYGKVKMWYPNGDKLLTGLVKDVNFRFKCDQEMQVNLENLYYLTYFDENGQQTINKGSGKVSEYHNNGELRLSGELLNGRRYGVWKFYDPNGRLEKIGKYNAKGNKDGLWVSGDLQAVPYYENMCMAGEVNAYNFPDVDKTGYVTQKIRIVELMYVDGNYMRETYMTMYPLY